MNNKKLTNIIKHLIVKEVQRANNLNYNLNLPTIDIDDINDDIKLTDNNIGLNFYINKDNYIINGYVAFNSEVYVKECYYNKNN